MKILYAIQGTGNGHLSRAREVVPLLQKKCETDILVSGYQADVKLPFEVKYQLHGLSFIFGKKGSVDLRRTYSKANTKKLISEIRHLPVQDYNFVINDFEPVSAWACFYQKVPCIAFSHQVSLLDKHVPLPAKKDAFGRFILKNYAPCSAQIGLHFSRYSSKVYTPVIRSEVRNAEISDKGHYAVYLPAYNDETLVKVLQKIPEARWQVFSKHNKQPVSLQNVDIKPINNQDFIASMASSTGVLCGAGFETPAEAMFMGKKLMVIPMQNQYEQQCNAAALNAMGVAVLRKLKVGNVDKIADWINSDFRIEITYPDITQKIVNRIFEMYVDGQLIKTVLGKGIKLKYWNKTPVL
jgi:uncharacterized protein (TIGR00661 family)